jgi:hypothetical protein
MHATPDSATAPVAPHRIVQWERSDAASLHAFALGALSASTRSRTPRMRNSRFTIARLLGVIVIFSMFLTALRSGSNDWFKLIHNFRR